MPRYASFDIVILYLILLVYYTASFNFRNSLAFTTESFNTYHIQTESINIDVRLRRIIWKSIEIND